ncbi:hypothetical protein [Massilia sp. BJB1822]|uniref:hypothetical protein n=1 Tax=Massilia sp. BJB1822 TaxID=2744470 RepID=UPI0015934B93|nr:hypothetical protein [Massilia sp. BJB1822]NVE01029.1 hypothetical protein [Massilia sp. BJB1822]
MYKKLALFVFAAATTLSASLATAQPPFCVSFCRAMYSACVKQGNPQAQCKAEQQECLASGCV